MVYSAKEFRVVFELLLHEAIDACVPIFVRMDKLGVDNLSVVKHHPAVAMRLRTLTNVLDLVGHFGPSAVGYLVAALRKTEPHVSFRHVLGLMDEGGSAKVAPDLFNSGLKEGRLYQAAALLLLVQYSAGPDTARRDYALPLLKAALDSGDKALAEQCVRFYSAMGSGHPVEVVECIREHCVKLVKDCNWVELLSCLGIDGTVREFLDGVTEPEMISFDTVVQSLRRLMLCDRPPEEAPGNDVGIVCLAEDSGDDAVLDEGSPVDDAGLTVSRRLFSLLLSLGWSRHILAMCVASRDPRSLAFAMAKDPVVKEMYNVKRAQTGDQPRGYEEWLEASLECDSAEESSEVDESGSESDEGSTQLPSKGFIMDNYPWKILESSPRIALASTIDPEVWGGLEFVVVLLFRSGRFAGCVWDEDGKIVEHTTFKKYTVRRKQGGAQRNFEQAKSMGAFMRRTQDAKIRQDVSEVVSERWREYLGSPKALVFVGSPRQDQNSIFVGPLKAGYKDTRVAKVPLSFRAPTFTEVLRVYNTLMRIMVEGSADGND
ncbi:conserved hypothetical protein [Perkinsus marinus ATCC 50983]|uniref:VLRF1 domain-containing protein n=1 Tax=Perkinsus marinus (strain ATCC 50983 / TXsc) TaxID=423536 RepID=C5KXP0_PERM5|nr:conserved hypothetical protein [Perkinsus marinus ATCC 50983]EER10764.1 conserved hypothetical protein [Perkinsus marinus ATCC 50983]|eukprot:XP_002778969.1 conserved hypothetical protein [Perkinsus marinus ATCC 50983]